jgi:hypothetical protein
LGWTELDYERKKASAGTANASFEQDVDLLDRVREFGRAASGRGTDYMTFRRIVEALAPRDNYAKVREHLIRHAPDRYEPPLWRVSERQPF